MGTKRQGKRKDKWIAVIVGSGSSRNVLQKLTCSRKLIFLFRSNFRNSQTDAVGSDKDSGKPNSSVKQCSAV